MSASIIEADIYNSYRWTRLVQLYLNRHKILRGDIAYRGFDILLALDAAQFTGQPLSVAALCKTLEGPKDTILAAIAKLEKTGLVQHMPSDNDVLQIIRLTPKGLRIMQWGYRRLFRILHLPTDA